MALWIAFIGTFITAIAALAGAIYAAKASHKAALVQTAAQKEIARTAPYDSIEARLEKLEPRVDHLEKEQAIDRAYIRTLLSLIYTHAPDIPLPAPPSWYIDEMPATDGDSGSAV